MIDKKICKFSNCIFFVYILIVLFNCKLNATTFYVSLSGNDGWSGTLPDSAWRHIAYATQQIQAGDSVLVFSGIYENEYVVFANSGFVENPIVLTAYNDTFTLDGIDSTGRAIRMVDKSFINISKFHIKNYGTGIRGEGLLTNLEIGNFVIEGIDGNGVNFDGASLQNSLITNFAIRNTDGIAISHFDYSSTDCHDIEISNFLIRDINNEGINWRNTKRVHIHHGEIYNTVSDGIHLQLSVDSSTVEYVRIDSTGFHGIAIHDHTVGDYPCSTNVIKNCYVANSGHNDIDLHSGAFNTIIEACTLGGPLTNGQAIYFHNLGAGLIVRNCIIHNVSGEGIDGGPSTGYYLRDILIENNIFNNLSTGIMFQGATENITIRGNRIYNTPYDINVGAYNILIDSNYTENGYYRINGNDGRIFDALDTNYHARSAYGSLVIVGHTNGKVFEQENAGGYGPYTINKPMWYPDGGYFTMQADSFWCDVDVNTYKMTVIPNIDSLEVSIITWDTTGTYYKKWMEICESPNVVTSHTVGDLHPNSTIEVKINNIPYDTLTADSSGWIAFDYTSGFASDTVIFEAEVIPSAIEEAKVNKNPSIYSLSQNFPNPFRSRTEIMYSLPVGGNVEINIYNITGQKVRILVNSNQNSGYYHIIWDGKDDMGKGVGSGIYYYELRTKGYKSRKKIEIIR